MFVANLVLLRDMEVKVAASDSSAGPADDADVKGGEPPRGAASSDAAPASVLDSVKAWEPFEKPQDRFEK